MNVLFSFSIADHNSYDIVSFRMRKSEFRMGFLEEKCSLKVVMMVCLHFFDCVTCLKDSMCLAF